MRKYEAIFIYPPEETPDASKEADKRLEETLNRFKGRIIERKDWGRRLLGYPLGKFKEGRFLLWNFEMEASQIAEFQKALHLDEKILKSTLVKAVEPRVPKESRKKPIVAKVATPASAPPEAIRGRESQ